MKSTKNTELGEYLNLLQHYGYVCEHNQKNDKVPYDYIKFSIGADAMGRSRHMVVNIIDTTMNVPKGKGVEEYMNIEKFVQLTTLLPFTVNEGHMGEVARMLMFYNKTLDIPGFGLDEITRTIFFRYAFIKPNSVMNKETFMGIVGMIILLLDSFTNSIEEVAAGASMKDTLTKILDINNSR